MTKVTGSVGIVLFSLDNMFRTLLRAFLSLGMYLLGGLLSAQPGLLDPTFNTGGSGANGAIYASHVLDDGRILIAGSLTMFNGSSCGTLARLNSNGTLDNTFQPASINGPISGMRVLNDDRIAIRGTFTTVGGVPRPWLAILFPDGSLDPTFDPSALIAPLQSASFLALSDLEFDAQCRALVYFSTALIGAAPFQNIYRLLPNGSVDTTYQGTTVTSGALAALADLTIRADGRILLVSEWMDAVNGISGSNLVLLEPDGTLAQGFTADPGLGTPVSTCALPNGQLIVGHDYSFMGLPRLVRLNLDGSIDHTFNSGGTGPNGSVKAIHRQQDGKLWITGTFLGYNGHSRYHIAKLHEDGTPDQSFAPSYGQGPLTGDQISGIITDLERKPILHGSFTSYSTAQTPVGRIVRIISCPIGTTCLPDTTFHCDPTVLCGCLPGPPLVAGPRFLTMKALLQGPRMTTAPGYMTDILRLQGALPLEEPYSAMSGFSAPVHVGGDVIPPTLLYVAGANAIVDWVHVELRDSADGTTVIAARSALLQRDGDVVDIDGASPLMFTIPSGHYRIALRHRNHLGVMTADAFAFWPNATTSVDLRAGAVPLHGTSATFQANGFHYLWAGNAVPDGSVKYTGSGNDRDVLLQTIGGTVPTATIMGYHGADLNLDGIVKYTGTNNDNDLILQSIGGVVPTNTRGQQLP